MRNAIEDVGPQFRRFVPVLIACCVGLLVAASVSYVVLVWEAWIADQSVTASVKDLVFSLLVTTATVAFAWTSVHALRLERATRRESEQKSQLERHSKVLEVALHNMARGLSMFDADQRLIVCNQIYRDMFDLPDWLTRTGTPFSEIIEFHAERETGRNTSKDLQKQQEWIANHVAALARGESFSHVQHLKDGRVILVTNQPLPDGGWVDLLEDITERRQVEEKINRLAHYDALTEIPNRFHFQHHVEEGLSRLEFGEGLALHMVDLDQFKLVNDTFGHPVGDLLLQSVSNRLRNAVRAPDFVGRLGGDEFAIVQAGVTAEAQARSFADRLVRILGEPYQIHGIRLEVPASVGVAMAPQHGRTAGELLKKADIALYVAKSHGRGTAVIFQAAYGELIQTRQQLETDLRVAIEEQQLELHYQPVVGAKTRKVKSFEALMRWRHPTRGLIMPGDFIPLAEETGLIVEMGAWALEQACRDAASWPDNISVAVNLSSRQFDGCDLYAVVREILTRTGLAAERLELEITETALLKDDEKTIGVLTKLCELGVRTSLDDFGTAFASLSYLRRFPFHKIKIDRSFVRELPQSDECGAIIETMARLARRLHMSTVAEGVETEEQLAAVVEAGCDQVQGFYFSRPVPSIAVEQVLSQCRAKLGTAA